MFSPDFVPTKTILPNQNTKFPLTTYSQTYRSPPRFRNLLHSIHQVRLFFLKTFGFVCTRKAFEWSNGRAEMANLALKSAQNFSQFKTLKKWSRQYSQGQQKKTFLETTTAHNFTIFWHDTTKLKTFLESRKLLVNTTARIQRRW